MMNMYDVDPHIAEIYDQIETYADDVELIRNLIKNRRPLRILEPFCGTGRILIPLAQDGHSLIGIDQAKGMLNLARTKIVPQGSQVTARIELIEANAISCDWPRDFDLVILGANSFYELATPEEQEQCIISANRVLNAGGWVYVDNNHMEGDLDESWQKPGVEEGFPTGTCRDGTRVTSTKETIWFDVHKRLVRFRRCTKVITVDGNSFKQEYIQQKHPVSADEVKGWLTRHHFEIIHFFGDRKGNPYTPESNRAIFWARKKE